MNFTREPIIETIITPKEGYKLAVRNTKGNEQEEYFVDAVEVVSFGNSFFFRSLERPKPFLVPVTDFQVVEVKETRMVLKNVAPERAIKIGGGREARKEPAERAAETSTEEAPSERSEMEVRPEGGRMKKRDRRRHRRRGPEDRAEPKEWAEKKEDEHKPEEITAEPAEKGGGADDETQVSSSIFSTLFPPPTTLISETLGKYKEKDHGVSQGNILPEPVEEEPEEKSPEEEVEEEKKKEEDASGSDSEHLSRISSVSTGYYETQSFSSTHIYKLNDSFDSPFLK